MEPIDFDDLLEEEKGWSYVGIAAVTVLLLVWAWLMVVFLSAAFG